MDTRYSKAALVCAIPGLFIDKFFSSISYSYVSLVYAFTKKGIYLGTGTHLNNTIVIIEYLISNRFKSTKITFTTLPGFSKNNTIAYIYKRKIVKVYFDEVSN